MNFLVLLPKNVNAKIPIIPPPTVREMDGRRPIWPAVAKTTPTINFTVDARITVNANNTCSIEQSSHLINLHDWREEELNRSPVESPIKVRRKLRKNVLKNMMNIGLQPIKLVILAIKKNPSTNWRTGLSSAIKNRLPYSSSV